MIESLIKSKHEWFISIIKCRLSLFTKFSVYWLFYPFKNLFLRLYSTTMFVDWNSIHQFLYKVLSRNAQRYIFVDSAGVRFIIEKQPCYVYYDYHCYVYYDYHCYVYYDYHCCVYHDYHCYVYHDYHCYVYYDYHCYVYYDYHC